MFWVCGKAEHDFAFIQMGTEVLWGLPTGDKNCRQSSAAQARQPGRTPVGQQHELRCQVKEVVPCNSQGPEDAGVRPTHIDGPEVVAKASRS